MDNTSARRVRVFWRPLILLLLATPALRAQQTTEDLRDLARNPVGDAVKIPFAESINFGAGPYDRTSNCLQIEPTIPFHIAESWLLIPRIVATAVDYQPEANQASHGSTGLGDTVATFFLTPAYTKKVIWGAGPALLIPTTTNTNTGAGKWGLGPSVAVLVQPTWGSLGVLVQNIWSLPGHSQRASVNQMQLETSFSYNFPHGWYLVTAPTFYADWTQPASERWVVPFGGGAGRTFNIGKQAVDSNLTMYYNAIRPSSHLSPRWQLSLEFTLIYPKKRQPAAKDRQVSSGGDPRVETK